MNMQNLLAQAQKMQRELKKAQEEFTASKGGAVSVVAYGDRKIKSISIEPSALEVDNKEMLEEMLKLAIEEVMGNIKLAEEELNARITGRAEGMMGL